MPSKAQIDQLLARSRKLVKSQSAEALALAEEARHLASEQDAHDLETAALCLHAHALLLQGRHDETLRTLEHACLLVDLHDVGQHEGEALHLFGQAHFARSHYLEAGECWRRCLLLPPEAIHTEARARAHIGLGMVNLTQELYAIALEHHRMAEALALETDDPTLHSDAQLHVAADLIKIGEYDESMRVLRELLPQVRAEKSYEMEAEVYGLIGDIYLARKDLEKAQTTLLVALKINRLTVNLTGEAANLISLGQCELLCREFESAIDFLNTARALSLESGSKRLLCRAVHGLANVYTASGDTEQAALLAEEYENLYQEMTNPAADPSL